MSDQGVGEDDQFSSDCGEGELRGFSVGSQMLIEVLEVGVAAASRYSGHVEILSKSASSTADRASALARPAVACEGGEAGQGGNLLGIESPDLCQASQNGQNVGGADTWDRLDDGGAAGGGRIGGDQGLDPSLQFSDMSLKAAQPAGELPTQER